MCVYIHIYTYVCTHMCVYIYIYIYIRIHANIHTFGGISNTFGRGFESTVHLRRTLRRKAACPEERRAKRANRIYVYT